MFCVFSVCVLCVCSVFCVSDPTPSVTSFGVYELLAGSFLVLATGALWSSMSERTTRTGWEGAIQLPFRQLGTSPQRFCDGPNL